MKIIINSITIAVYFLGTQLFAGIHEVNNDEIIILMGKGIPLIDIRTIQHSLKIKYYRLTGIVFFVA